jgi:leucyl aminopeptidase (aminopeptidase T)
LAGKVTKTPHVATVDPHRPQPLVAHRRASTTRPVDAPSYDSAMPDLGLAVATIINRCLAVRAGEDVLVVADRGTGAIGEALRDGAANIGAEAVLMVMDPREVDGNEPPRAVAGALAACDVFIAPTTRSLSHTRARKQANDAGARGATMPGATEAMLARTMSVDFDAMAVRSRAVAAVLTQADSGHLTCPRGTDFTLDLAGRQGSADDGQLTERGAFGNLPCGEGYISPCGGEGTVVVAATVASLGIADEPMTLTVESGQLAGAQGGLGPRFIELLRGAGDSGTNLAELGIGTNERAQLSGNVLEDEKILGTVHIAFGASAGIGGTVSIPIHLDVVILEPTLDIGGERVIDAGRFVLGAEA